MGEVGGGDGNEESLDRSLLDQVKGQARCKSRATQPRTSNSKGAWVPDDRLEPRRYSLLYTFKP
jgi:hypothetical protein